MKTERKWVSLIKDSKTTERKFVNLINQETQQITKCSDLKTRILECSLLDFLMEKMRNKSIIVEGKDITINQQVQGKSRGENIYSTETWTEFEEQAKVILALLNISEDQSNQTLTKLRELFSNLGEGDASKGLGFFKDLDSYLIDCGGDNTQPKLKASLLLKDWKAEEIRELLNIFDQVKENGGTLLTALRKVARLKNKTTSLKQLIDLAYGENKLEIDENIITKLTRFNSVKKRTSVGQGEVLFAILFKDCKLGNVGDIDCYTSGIAGRGQVVPVELKANSAGPDDIGRRKVEEVLKACGYEYKKQKTKTHAFNAYQNGEEEWFWIKKGGEKKEPKAGSIPTVNLRDLQGVDKEHAFDLLDEMWKEYLKKVNGHGSSNAYIVYIRPGSPSQPINGWIENNLLIIQNINDIHNAFEAGLLNIKAQTMQGNEFMTFKLELTRTPQGKK